MMNHKFIKSWTRSYLIITSLLLILCSLQVSQLVMSLSTNNLNNNSGSSTGKYELSTQLANNHKMQLESRIRGALWGLLSGDALAAPTHWYYGGFSQVVNDYGRNGITDYTKPKLHLAGSIMNKSNINGGGRGAFSMVKSPDGGKAISIIGDVINHGKRDYWDPKHGIHYHATLNQGENTLEAQLVRVLMKSIVQNHGRIHASHFVQSYINFMTTPGTHNDTYASTCHRMFFVNYALKKLPPDQCPDNDHHNVDTIDGLILPTIAAIAACAYGGTVQEVRDVAAQVAAATRRSNVLEKTSRAWGDLVYDVMNSDDSKVENQGISVPVKKTAKSLGMPVPRDNGRDEISACYLDTALPTTFDMLCKYGKSKDMVWDALLANANSGGENVHRGALLGAVLGASAGYERLPSKLVNGLYEKDKIAAEIDEFVHAVMQASLKPTDA